MKNILFLIVALLLVQEGTAQQGLYFRLNTGYGLAANGEVLGMESTTNTAGETTMSNKYGTIGAGIPITLGLGYRINPYFAFQLSGTYLLGDRVETNRNTAETADGSLVATREAFTRQVQLSPSLVIHPLGGEGAKIDPYVRFGLVLPVAGATYSEDRGDLQASDFAGLALANPALANPDFQAEVDATVSGTFSLGYNAAVGIDYNINEQSAVFIEASYVGLRIRRSSLEITRAQFINGDQVIEIDEAIGALPPAFQPEFNTHVEYRDELTQAEIDAAVAEGDYGTASNPALELRSDANMNALRFNIGFRYGLFQ